MLKIVLFLLPIALLADSLYELIDNAEKNNDLVISKQYTQESKSKELKSKNSAYFPTLDLGGYYERDDKASPFQAGDTYSGFAKLSYNIYDGGKRSAEVNQADYSLKSSAFDVKAYKKSLALQITQDFFSIKSLYASLNAREEAQKLLKKQLERIKSFYAAKMATQDDIDRVQADFDTNVYEIESIKFQILSLKSQLSLKVGTQIGDLEDTVFKKDTKQMIMPLDTTKSLIAQNKSLKYSAETIDSFYYPNIKIEDTYSLYKYSHQDPALSQVGVSPLDKQNTLLVTLNLRLFDYGALHNTKEAVLLTSQALNSQITYQTKKQKADYNLALSRIKTAKSRIKSAKSALTSAKSAFQTIEKKYNADIVDYIIYLNALTKQTSSKALYKRSLNELEIAYAIYYFYCGKNIKEELQ